jgi:hypothetical protein
MASPGAVHALPFKGERFSFAAKWSSSNPDSEQQKLNLAAVAFDREGKFIGATCASQHTALSDSLRHAGGASLAQGDDAFDADEVVHMYPQKMVPECEVMAKGSVVPATRRE